MSKTETIGNATLYLGDCRDILPEMSSVDAVVTDPPYGIGFKYQSHVDDPDTYHEFIWPIIEKSEALAIPGAPIVVWQAMINVRNFAQWFPRNWRLFCAAKNFVQVRPTAMQYSWDPVLVWWKEGGKPYRADNWGRDYFVADTASVVGNWLEKAGHPCPRPLDHCWYIIERFVAPRSLVLDPFMGSGTTGVAALKLGRRFIGIEIEKSYFANACRRIEKAARQGDLFLSAYTTNGKEKEEDGRKIEFFSEGRGKVVAG